MTVAKRAPTANWVRIRIATGIMDGYRFCAGEVRKSGIRRMGQNMKQTTNLRIEGMTCANCAVHVEKALEAVPRVESVSVRLEEGARVEHDGADEASLIRAVATAGDYKAEVVR